MVCFFPCAFLTNKLCPCFFMIFFSWSCLDLSCMSRSLSQFHMLCDFEFFFLCVVNLQGSILFCRGFMVISIWTVGICFSLFIVYFIHFLSLFINITFGKKSVTFYPWLTHQFVYFLFYWFFILNFFRSFVFIWEERKITNMICFLLQHITQDPPECGGPWCDSWYRRVSSCWFCQMLNFSRSRNQPRAARSMSLGGKFILPNFSTNVVD
jgi:hypothetical protein